ncbi:MAG TPA: hypothetical protein VKU00_13625 [Chthonomonadaceae bacterium]|nr:hypothetical protein [Chthonomonadaceae bacterium]
MSLSSPLAPEPTETFTEAVAQERTRTASWRQLFPSHRLPVLSKTPLLIALGLTLTGGRFDPRTVGTTMVLFALLWADLYALNEATDLELEQGLQVPRRYLIPLYLLPCLLCIGALCLSVRLLLPFGLTMLSQFAYCVPPFRLKRWWWAILLLSGVLNPILRLEAGAVWGAHSIPLLAYVAFVSLHLGAALRARGLQRARDSGFGYAIAPHGCDLTGILCTLIGIAVVFLLCLQGVLPKQCLYFLIPCIGFAIYAWSGRAKSMSDLRQGWLWFAVLALIALVILLTHK